MTLDDHLRGLRGDLKPSKAASDRMKARIMKRVDAPMLKQLAEQTVPPATFGKSVLKQIRSRIELPSASRIIPSLKDAISLSKSDQTLLWNQIFGRLQPVRVSIFSQSLKWTAAFAISVFIIQLLPLALLAPSTQAVSRVEIIAEGAGLEVLIGGISVPVSDRLILENPALISTGEGTATLLIHDDAVVRLAPHSTVRLHDLTDRPEPTLPTTFSFVKGKIWVLGLLPPTVDSLGIQLPNDDVISIREGSLSIADAPLAISMIDHRASVTHNDETLYLVTGERMTFSSRVSTSDITKRDLSNAWVSENMTKDAAHRREVLALQREEWGKSAGILPTSILYPVKRVAEEVNVLFTVGSDAKAQKRIEQADTRLSEALALLNDGETEEANAPLEEYKETLFTIAAGTGDNLVKFLIKQQLTEASTDIAVVSPEDDLYAVKQSVLEMSATIPDANLKPEEVQGYLLVEKLSSIDRTLSSSGQVTEAITLYKDIQPYLTELLTTTGSELPSPLQREAKTLLQNASDSLEEIKDDLPEDASIVEVQSNIEQFLPRAPEKVPTREKQDIDVIVAGIVKRIFSYEMPRSRLNQLILEMKQLVGDPDRGSILRQLYQALPENGLARNVRAELARFSGEVYDATH